MNRSEVDAINWNQVAASAARRAGTDDPDLIASGALRVAKFLAGDPDLSNVTEGLFVVMWECGIRDARRQTLVRKAAAGERRYARRPVVLSIDTEHTKGGVPLVDRLAADDPYEAVDVRVSWEQSGGDLFAHRTRKARARARAIAGDIIAGDDNAAIAARYGITTCRVSQLRTEVRGRLVEMGVA